MEEFKCPVEGCEHEPFKTETALKSHLRSKHPDSVPKVEEREVPIVEEDFATLLRKFKIKGDLATNIAENISHTGGPSVFEDPELLFKRLTAWSSDVNPSRRKLIIEQWFAERGVNIPLEIQQKAGMTTDQMQKAEAEKKGGAEVRYVYDEETHVIRMAKKDEVGGTLAQAKELKKIAEVETKGGTEVRYVFDEETHVVRMAKEGEGGGTLAQAKELKKMAEAETKTTSEVTYIYDPESRQVRMAKEGERGGTLAQAKELKKMADEDEGEGTESPFMKDGEGHWILNPKARVSGVELMAVQFMQQAQAKGEPADPITAMTRAAETWKTLREGLGVGAGTPPSWQTDPAEFIKTVKAITGETEGDSALKQTLTEMRQSMEEMKEQRYRDQFAAQQKQIQDLSTVAKQTMETISDLQKGRVGRTEMDIIHEIVTGGKEELSGLRRDVREAFTSTSLPPGKSAEEREGRKQRVKKALKTDQEIEDLGKRLFFPQG